MDLRLDGNAVAGLLMEIFAREMTATPATCGACAQTEPLGAEHVYMHAPGVVVRCCHCDSVLMVIVQSPERYWISLSGLHRLELRPGG